MQQKWWLGLVLVGLLGGQPASAAAGDPKAVVGTFYQWYLKTGEHVRDRLAQQKSAFHPDLYRRLQTVFHTEAVQKEAILDFDPFDNAQMPAVHYAIGQVNIQGATAQVPIALDLSRQGHSSLTVVLKRTGDQWQIADFLYPGDSSIKPFTLTKYLHDQHM